MRSRFDQPIVIPTTEEHSPAPFTAVQNDSVGQSARPQNFLISTALIEIIL